MCPRFHVNFYRRHTIKLQKQLLIFKWEQNFCWNCGIRLVLKSGLVDFGDSYWKIPVFVIKRNLIYDGDN